MGILVYALNLQTRHQEPTKIKPIMKRIIQRLAMAVAMIVTALSANAIIEIDGISYTSVSERTVTVCEVSSDITSCIIPQNITWKGETFTVISIDGGAFKEENH